MQIISTKQFSFFSVAYTSCRPIIVVKKRQACSWMGGGPFIFLTRLRSLRYPHQWRQIFMSPLGIKHEIFRLEDECKNCAMGAGFSTSKNPKILTPKSFFLKTRYHLSFLSLLIPPSVSSNAVGIYLIPYFKIIK